MAGNAVYQRDESMFTELAMKRFGRGSFWFSIRLRRPLERLVREVNSIIMEKADMTPHTLAWFDWNVDKLCWTYLSTVSLSVFSELAFN